MCRNMCQLNLRRRFSPDLNKHNLLEDPTLSELVAPQLTSAETSVLDLKSAGRKAVRVRAPLPAPQSSRQLL
jgi:hypothetical protein